MTFKAILQALEGELKLIDVTTNFRSFYSKKMKQNSLIFKP